MNDDLNAKIMEQIRSGKVQMVPRWRFLLSSALVGLGALILFCTLLYIVSFSVFMLRQDGALFVPLFGMRGVFAFLGALPTVLIALVVLFLLVLEILVRRYSFIYRRPLLVSVASTLVIVFLGGIALERTRIHGELYREARGGALPPPFQNIYRGMPARVPDVERGEITALVSGGFVLKSADNSTTTVLIDSHTRLPFGANFSVGDQVVVFGHEASGTIRAFGVGPVGD